MSHNQVVCKAGSSFGSGLPLFDSQNADSMHSILLLFANIIAAYFSSTAMRYALIINNPIFYFSTTPCPPHLLRTYNLYPCEYCPWELWLRKSLSLLFPLTIGWNLYNSVSYSGIYPITLLMALHHATNRPRLKHFRFFCHFHTHHLPWYVPTTRAFFLFFKNVLPIWSWWKNKLTLQKKILSNENTPFNISLPLLIFLGTPPIYQISL